MRYQIDGFNSIRDILIPFVDKYQFYTFKAVHYNIFRKVLLLVDSNQHLTESGFLNIIDLAYNMNLDGKRRKYTKEEYIEKYVSQKS